MNSVFIFLLLPLATKKVYSSVSKIGHYNAAISLKGYNFTFCKCDFQISQAKIYQNVNFQLTSSSESKDIPISDAMLEKNGF